MIPRPMLSRPLLRKGAAALPWLLLLVLSPDAAAQGLSGGGDPSVSARAMQMVLGLTILSLAPGILMTVTSFTRIVVALSLLRSGIGAPGVPPNPIIISLALFLSFFVMAPTFQSAWRDGVQPYNAGRISEERAITATTEPFRAFMQKHVRADDVRLFARMSAQPAGVLDL